MDSTPGARLADAIAQATRHHDQRGDPYLAKVRRLTSQIGSGGAAPDDLRDALLALEDHVRIDLEVPTGSRRRGAAVLKAAVKRLTGWYFRYLGEQVTLLGQAIVKLATALVNRTERLEERSVKLADDQAALVARIERLERGSGGP